MEQGIVYIVMGLVCVICFLAGKYVMPGAQETVNKALNLLSGYPLLMQWGMSACKYIKQYFNDMSGEEKNKRAAELIIEVAKQAGVTITEDQARAIAQAAYEQMKAGELEADKAEKKVTANA